MINNKLSKSKMVFIGIVFILIGCLGITYAFFTYNRIGDKESLIVTGDIYMHYVENNQLSIENAIPRDIYDANKYFEFSINGKNTSSEDIYYEILLDHGDNHPTRTERIKDYFLDFRLVEVNNGVEAELFNSRSYSDLQKKKIWVDTIKGENDVEFNKLYRLYMWINNDLLVGVGDNIDYSMDTWNNQVYASIKVIVNGGLEEMVLETPEEAFNTSVFYDENNQRVASLVGYDFSYGNDVVIPETIRGARLIAIGNYQENPLMFTNNSKTKGKIQFLVGELDSYPNIVYDGLFYNENFETLYIPDSVKIIDKAAFAINNLKKVYIGSGIEYIGEGAFFQDVNCSSGCNEYLESITIDKTCEEIKKIPGSKGDSKSYFPWTSSWWYGDYDWPYANPVKIYGSNNEYCGEFY